MVAVVVMRHVWTCGHERTCGVIVPPPSQVMVLWMTWQCSTAIAVQCSSARKRSADKWLLRTVGYYGVGRFSLLLLQLLVSMLQVCVRVAYTQRCVCECWAAFCCVLCVSRCTHVAFVRSVRALHTECVCVCAWRRGASVCLSITPGRLLFLAATSQDCQELCCLALRKATSYRPHS